ncbi:hypothetical protein D3C87_2183390 [compost metagenome]
MPALNNLIPIELDGQWQRALRGRKAESAGLEFMIKTFVAPCEHFEATAFGNHFRQHTVLDDVFKF